MAGAQVPWGWQQAHLEPTETAPGGRASLRGGFQAEARLPEGGLHLGLALTSTLDCMGLRRWEAEDVRPATPQPHAFVFAVGHAPVFGHHPAHRECR